MAEINITVEERELPDVVEITTGIIGPPGPPGPAGPPVLRGAWSPIATYQPDDLVTRDGSTWIATAVNTGIDPVADPSNTNVGSLVPTSPLALGSPTAVASGFTVDRVTNAVALNVAASWNGTAGGTVGLASAINVPGVGVQWLGKGPVQVGGRVTLDNPATMHPGVNYWLVMIMHAANIQIDQGGDMVGFHLAWNGEFWYGSTEPSNDFKIYALGFILFGTTSDNAWQLFVARGEPGTTVLTAPNGSKWRLVVDNTGTLSTVAVP